VARAFKDCITTYYEARAAGRRAEGALLARRAEAGGRLIALLEDRGVKVAPDAAGRGLIGLVPLVERFLHTRTEEWTLAVVEPAAGVEEARRAGEDAWPGSVLIGAGVERRAGLEVALAGRRARYALITYEEEACPPYEAWRARRPSDAPRLHIAGDAVYARRGAFRAPGVPPGGPDDVTVDEAVDLAAAALLFRDEPDAARRDAKTLIALLDGERAPLALRALGALLGSRAAAIALESFRAAGVDAVAPEGWPARLFRTTPDECHAIVKTARRPGGLLDTPGGP
jgi:hypothetical protein